jgi:hypothetical protein
VLCVLRLVVQRGLVGHGFDIGRLLRVHRLLGDGRRIVHRFVLVIRRNLVLLRLAVGGRLVRSLRVGGLLGLHRRAVLRFVVLRVAVLRRLVRHGLDVQIVLGRIVEVGRLLDVRLLLGDGGFRRLLRSRLDHRGLLVDGRPQAVQDVRDPLASLFHLLQQQVPPGGQILHGLVEEGVGLAPCVALRSLRGLLGLSPHRGDVFVDGPEDLRDSDARLLERIAVGGRALSSALELGSQ